MFLNFIQYKKYLKFSPIKNFITQSNLNIYFNIFIN